MWTDHWFAFQIEEDSVQLKKLQETKGTRESDPCLSQWLAWPHCTCYDKVRFHTQGEWRSRDWTRSLEFT